MEQFKSLFYRPSAAAVVALLSVTVFYIFAGVEFGKLMGAASWVNYAARIGIVALPVCLLMVAGRLIFQLAQWLGAMTTAIISRRF